MDAVHGSFRAKRSRPPEGIPRRPRGFFFRLTGQKAIRADCGLRCSLSLSPMKLAYKLPSASFPRFKVFSDSALTATSRRRHVRPRSERRAKHKRYTARLPVRTRNSNKRRQARNDHGRKNSSAAMPEPPRVALTEDQWDWLRS